MSSECRRWSEGDPILEEYHDHEWCKINHNNQYQFEMLCLEGASAGLSWATILHKRANYCRAFHDFDIDACAAMTDDELISLLSNPGLIRNRNVGPVITYSFLQSIGIINDHLADCECR